MPAKPLDHSRERDFRSPLTRRSRSRGPALRAGRGSDLHRRIWKAVARIPRGRVSTYGRIAALAGLGSNARLVGYALHALPSESEVPWHRVVNARGSISLPEGEGAWQLQRALLVAERVSFRDGCIDLARYGWPGSRPGLPTRARR